MVGSLAIIMHHWSLFYLTCRVCHVAVLGTGPMHIHLGHTALSWLCSLFGIFPLMLDYLPILVPEIPVIMAHQLHCLLSGNKCCITSTSSPDLQSWSSKINNTTLFI